MMRDGVIQGLVIDYRAKFKAAEADGTDRISILITSLQELRRVEDDPERAHTVADAMLLAMFPESVADSFLAVPRWYS